MTKLGAVQDVQPASACPCPDWCTSQHGVQYGEEDWVHIGAPLLLADGVSARLCMSCDPTTQLQDGPFVLIGERECTLEEAAALGVSLVELAVLADPARSS